MHKSKYINIIIQYIEKCLSDEINPDNIAKRHFISLSQMYRDFYSYTGHSIKEYIRKRRISNACEKLKSSDIPLSVIASESGCETQQSFQKQFKTLVGMTPIEYKNSNRYFYFYPFFVNDISIAVKVGAENIPQCTTERFYDSCLRGIEDKAIESLGKINSRVFGRNGKQIDNQFCYEIMTEKDGIGKTGTYSTCVVDYNENDINNGWNYLYNIWLSISMFEQAGDGYFEEYFFKNGKPHKLKLYLPVKKREAAHNIRIAQIPKMTFLVSKVKGLNAERKASENVIGFLNEKSPFIINNAKNFYICVYDGICECGVELDSGIKLPENSNLEILHILSGTYAILPDDCLGDISIGSEKMNLWLMNNSIAYENEPIFAVYESLNGRYDTDNIKMKLYKRLKDDKNG